MNWDLIARTNALQQRVDRLTAPQPAAERDALATAQARADSVAAHFGGQVSAPILGETPLAYRKRVLLGFQRHSPRFKNTQLGPLDSPSLSLVEDHVYADAVAAAKKPPPGVMREVSERDAAGRLISRFYGDPSAWMDTFMSSGVSARINRSAGK